MQEAANEALGTFAEAAQDMVTAGLERSLGRNFACADVCNQVAEKAVQAVAVVRLGHRAPYDHDLAALGAVVEAPPTISAALAALTPYHPEAFHAHTAPELADDAVTAEEVEDCMRNAKLVLRWAREIVMAA